MATANASWRAGHAPAAACLCLLAFAAVQGGLGAPPVGIDDADITAVYARNLAHGHGYVYTPGGERVEGSTSLAWTLVSAIPFALGTGVRPLFLVTLLLTTAAALACARLAALGGEGPDRTAGRMAAPAFFLALLGASPVFFLWMMGTLMDTALWSALLCCAAALALAPPGPRTSVALPGALAGLVLARPEGMAVAPALALLHGLARWLRGTPPGTAARATLAPLAVALGTTVALVLFRLGYFGYPLPNTYYAKIGADRLYTAVEGMRYVYRGLRDQPANAFGVALAAWIVLRDARRLLRRRGGTAAADERCRVRWLTALTALGGFALPLALGFDHFWGYRMLQPFVPLLAVVAALELAGRWPAWRCGRRVAAGALVVLLAGHAWLGFARTGARAIRGEIQLALDGREIGARLGAELPAAEVRPTVGVTAAGGVAFTYPGRVLDLLGLNWVAMAHAHRDRRGHAGHAGFSLDVFWAEPATVVLPGLHRAPPADTCALYSAWEDEHYHGLLSSARFRAEYVGMVLPSQAPSTARDARVLAMYVRRDYVARHAELGRHVLDWPDRCP